MKECLNLRNIESITYDDFCKIYDVRNIDLVSLGLFQSEDLVKLRRLAGYLTGFEKITNIVKNFPGYFLNIDFHFKNMINNNVWTNLFRDLFNSHTSDESPLSEIYPITDYNMKASIIAAFKPRNILEIGTYFGWGAASIKLASPYSNVFTMNPELNSNANNPIRKDQIGEVFISRKINVTQIWADSATFDFNVFPSLDAAYIDGNHDYDYVYSDLLKLGPIVGRIIVLDDYIPNANSPRGHVRSWGPWNKSVVAAVNDFLRTHPEMFQSCYWIEDSPIAVLIK